MVVPLCGVGWKQPPKVQMRDRHASQSDPADLEFLFEGGAAGSRK